MRPILIFLILSAAGTSHAGPAAENVTTVIIADGPYAGSYTADNAACIHIKGRNTFGSGWKAFSKNPKVKTLEEAGIQVDQADAPGAKTGDVIVKLLDGATETPHEYNLYNVPLTFMRSGKGGQISFDGKTKDGVHLRISASCVKVEEF